MGWNVKMGVGATILIFTDWYEPGFKAGGPIQSCRNFVAALKEEYRIYIITSDRDQGDASSYPGVPVNSWTEREGAAVYYAGPGHLTVARVRELVEEVSPDHIYLNSLFSLRYTIFPLWLRWRGRISSRVVIAPRGMLHEGALRFKPAKKKFFIRLLNMFRMPGKLVFQATDEQEEKDIRRHFPSAGEVRLVSNFSRMTKVEWRPVDKRPGELQAVFISRVAPKKNLLFFLEVLRETPAGVRVHFDIYGDVEDLDYKRKCSLVMAALPSHVRVDWKGAVPNHSVIDVLQQYHVFVLPTLGENFGHAIFEALLAGRPVLISDKTPWLDLRSGRLGYDLPLDAGLFGRALGDMAAMGQDEYNTWSKSAFEYACGIQASATLKEKYRELFPQVE